MKTPPIPFNEFSSRTSVVFFSGAGISAESGISTFRDPDGYWAKYDPMKLASPEGFQQNPELVLKWYCARAEAAINTKPNPAHEAISNFQKLFPQSVVITQNVDGLHTRAGNASVLELHGNIHRKKCFTCGELVDPEIESEEKGTITYCHCGGMLRPDVVWFGESLPDKVLTDAYEATINCQIFFSIGTSTQIYPAAQLPFEAQNHGSYVIEINPEPTPFSSHADICFRDMAGKVLPKLYEEFNAALA